MADFTGPEKTSLLVWFFRADVLRFTLTVFSMAPQMMSSATEFDSPVATDMLAPDFQVACDDRGGTRRLSDFRGHPVVLSFLQVRWDPSLDDQVALFNRLFHRFFGPGQSLVRVVRERLWCHLGFEDGQSDIPLLAPLAQYGEVARTYGVLGSNAVVVVGGDGLVRWKYAYDPGESKSSSDLLHAVAQLAPVLQARQRRGTITLRDCAATILAATAGFACRAIHAHR